MALTFGKGNRSIAFAPTAAFPLNANSYFESYELALAAALTAKPAGDTSTKYYFGQEIAVAEMVNNVPQSAKLYIIAPEVQEDGSVIGTLQEVGSATNGDNASIELVDGVLSVKDFGKRYYKYVAAVEGGEAAHYELTEGWVAGLEPKVVEVENEMVIGWYEPNPTTAEGVKDQVVEVQGQVDQAKEDINNLDEILNGTEDNPGGLVKDVEDIADVLYGTEGENPVPGLIEEVETLRSELEDADKALQEDIDAVAKDLADNYYIKTEVYTKSEVDGKVAGLFHFKGVVETLPETGTDVGEVYQIGDAEYAWNGTEWVKLGYTLDLSAYYTKTEVDAEVKKVQDEVDLAEQAITNLGEELNGRIDDEVETINGRIDDVAAEHETINSRIDTVSGNIESAVERIEALETAKEGFDTYFETVDGKIEGLEQADQNFVSQFETVNGKISALELVDEGFATRIGTLETNVGTPSENFKTALFPAVETLQSRIDGLVAVGGEANLINGLTINGTALVPNAERIIDLPVFAGTTAGLVPVAVEGLTNYHVLTAKGNWSNPFGDLGDKTVKAYVDDAIDSITILWESIV